MSSKREKTMQFFYQLPQAKKRDRKRKEEER